MFVRWTKDIFHKVYHICHSYGEYSGISNNLSQCENSPLSCRIKKQPFGVQGKEKDGCQLLAESLDTECLSCCTKVVMPEIFQSSREYDSASFDES